MDVVFEWSMPLAKRHSALFLSELITAYIAGIDLLCKSVRLEATQANMDMSDCKNYGRLLGHLNTSALLY